MKYSSNLFLLGKLGGKAEEDISRDDGKTEKIH